MSDLEDDVQIEARKSSGPERKLRNEYLRHQRHVDDWLKSDRDKSNTRNVEGYLKNARTAFDKLAELVDADLDAKYDDPAVDNTRVDQWDQVWQQEVSTFEEWEVRVKDEIEIAAAGPAIAPANNAEKTRIRNEKINLYTNQKQILTNQITS